MQAQNSCSQSAITCGTMSDNDTLRSPRHRNFAAKSAGFLKMQIHPDNLPDPRPFNYAPNRKVAR